jgi:hypothetical protein
MMTYPLLTRVTGGKQLYLHRNRLQVRDSARVQRAELDPALLVQKIASEFGIAQEVVANALRILDRKEKW